MSRPMARPARRLAALVAVALLATGCRWGGVRDMQLPGGAAAGGPTYRVTAVFDDVMDLVPQSSVRVNDVAVGDVVRISLGRHFEARVEMRIKRSVRLPANSVAVLQQTSLLGEKYVALLPPAPGQPKGDLADGATIPALRTSEAATVEEVFSALAALLNGGGVGQLHTISVELTDALSGREAQVRDFLAQLRTFVGGLDAHKADIVRALDSLDRLSATLARQRGTIATALERIAPGLGALADQRRQLTTMLAGLARLGHVATNVIRASRADTVADLAALRPILAKLDEAGTNLPGALELLLDYPFPKTATGAIKGDYAGLRLTLDLDSSIGNLLAPPPGGQGGGPLCPPVCLPGGGGGGGAPLPVPTPSLPGLPPLPGSGTGGAGPSGGAPSGGSADAGGLAALLLEGLP
ncbi:MAG: MCE family protein [Frankiaceae bacterium]